MIKVLHPGLFSTIQDMGRFGYRDQGVPVSGVMDDVSASFANALLNNQYSDALIEMTLKGPKLEFTAANNIVITGADMSPHLNDNAILNYHVYHVKEGDILSFGQLIKGLRSYLAVQGGLDSEIVLGSQSFYKDITKHASLKTNDFIACNSESNEIVNHESNIKTQTEFYESDCLEVYKGPDYDLFSSHDQQIILSDSYTVSKDNNRMGYQLQEVSVQHNKSIITSPVLPGTIQLTPAGKLIILLKDAQTSGGYPRILQLSPKSISILAQKKINDPLRFKILD